MDKRIPQLPFKSSHLKPTTLMSTCNEGDPGLVPGSGRSAGEGIVYPLQYTGTSLMA